MENSFDDKIKMFMKLRLAMKRKQQQKKYIMGNGDSAPYDKIVTNRN